MDTLSFDRKELRDLLALFADQGLGSPDVCAVAPGRVNVIGEHIDYNGGLVLPAAIDRWTCVALKAREDGMVNLRSSHGEVEPVSFSVEDLAKSEKRCWSNYVKGVLAGLKRKGFAFPGFDAVVLSTVPVGGGLSSSAALEAAFSKAVLELVGESMEPLELARLCQKAEHDYADVPCGLMDQAAVILCEDSKLLLLDCQDDSYRYADFDDPDWGLMIINSCVSHELSDGGYARRRDVCHQAAAELEVGTLREVPLAELDAVLAKDFMDEEKRRYVRHVVTEIDRTLRAVDALAARDYALTGQLLNESHASLRDDYRVSCPELDFISKTAQALEGVAGCRMTGGGFGGSAIALVRRDQADMVAETVADAYRERFGIEAGIFETRPAGGARSWRC
ncbi:galactokinase [Pelagicoccus sp. SDUM812003]|uniref:galactokinase n=1 Tax=Pelagicoccus sp. SDUM812003 TaxID=3041267 RepID=UPI002811D533|nr:galactokinase [Pelagicoccus sp. SDUM812003]